MSGRRIVHRFCLVEGVAAHGVIAGSRFGTKLAKLAPIDYPKACLDSRPSAKVVPQNAIGFPGSYQVAIWKHTLLI
jgi:hypothetical protein